MPADKKTAEKLLSRINQRNITNDERRAILEAALLAARDEALEECENIACSKMRRAPAAAFGARAVAEEIAEAISALKSPKEAPHADTDAPDAQAGEGK